MSPDSTIYAPDTPLNIVNMVLRIYKSLQIGIFFSKALVQRPTVQIRSKRFARRTMHSTPACGSVVSEILPDLIDARERLRSNLPMETFRVAGVTFEGRQDLVQSLAANTTVTLEKEPENPYDPNAVAVKLLNDEKLGYIPKQQTGAFIHQICFGRVRCVGQVQNGNWGCLVDTQPHLPPVIPLAIPGNLISDCRNLVHTLKGEAWERYMDEVAQRMNHTCSITGASTSSVEARWRILEGDRVVRLVGFAVQDSLLSMIQYLDFGTLSERDFVQVMEDLNDLTTEEATEIMSRQIEFSEIRRDSGWTIDVSYLKRLEI